MKIAIIGTGYVGLVTGICLAETGNKVICVDNDQKKLRKLKNGIVTIYEPGLEVLFHRNVENKQISFSDNLERAIGHSEVIFLCLPTPEGEDGSADLTYVLSVTEETGKILKKYGNKEHKTIVNKSTVPIGTADRISVVLKRKGARNFSVVSNPEFLREGFAVDDFMKPDRIVIGSDDQSALEKMKALYEPFVRQGNPILEMDISSAEVTKYASNSYLAMRITYMNELANYCETVGADVDLVRKGMGGDTRIGKRFLFPGIGYGGSCFPKDVKALIRSSIDYHSPMKILAAVDDVNNAQKHVLVTKILNHFKGNVKARHFAIWGLAFKPNTDDMREAPSLIIIDRLLGLGAKITAYDPASMEVTKGILKERIRYSKYSYDALKGCDALLILTEWNEFRNPDYSLMKKTLKSAVIFDGRNILDPMTMTEHGFMYYGIGRKRR